MSPATIVHHEAAPPAREQFEAASARGSIIGASGGNRRDTALLSRERWAAWPGFLRGEPLVPRPKPPVMLRHLDPTGDRLTAIAECRDVRN